MQLCAAPNVLMRRTTPLQLVATNSRKHATTVDHCAAVEARSARKDLQQAIANVNCSQEKTVIAALKTVYFMAKKNLANDIFGDMKQFLILQVNPGTLILLI